MAEYRRKKREQAQLLAQQQQLQHSTQPQEVDAQLQSQEARERSPGQPVPCIIEIMAKRKGLSAEEKQTKLLELFHESNDVFQLKDLERLAPQEKGIVMQSVKSTLQELVDNGQVESDKIAGSLYYWSFRSESLQKLNRQLAEMELKATKIQQRIDIAQSQVQVADDAMNDFASVEAITRELDVLRKEKESLEREAVKYSKSVNYEEVKVKEKDSKKILEAANRWTDNIFMVKTWCRRKFDKQDRELNKAFGIPEDLDYVNT